jgi:uncharacterized phage protein (TIGR01671 family)
MRELKFRVWHPEWKRFVYFSDLQMRHHNGDYCLYAKEDNCKTVYHFWSSKPAVQQFTGIQDKNSKEIYEGDVIFADETVYVVAFDFGIFGLEGENKKITPLYQYNNKELVIIGNIYENPELIKE